MKRIVILVSAAALLSGCALEPETLEHFDKYQLSTPARRIKVSAEFEDYEAFFRRDGRLDKVVYFDAAGKESSREVYEYDSLGRTSRIRYIDQTVEGQRRYSYDGQFVRTEDYYGGNNELVYRWENENDGKNITRVRHYSEDIPDFEAVRTWDGLRMHETPVGSEEDDAEVEFTPWKKIKYLRNALDTVFVGYNEAGLPVSISGAALNSIGDIGPSEFRDLRYEYTLDSRGNWTERKEFAGDSLTNSIKRVIKY